MLLVAQARSLGVFLGGTLPGFECWIHMRIPPIIPLTVSFFSLFPLLQLTILHHSYSYRILALPFSCVLYFPSFVDSVDGIIFWIFGSNKISLFYLKASKISHCALHKHVNTMLLEVSWDTRSGRCVFVPMNKPTHMQVHTNIAER